MKTYSLETIISVARSLSSYYKELYKKVPETGWKISDLPPVDQKTFWEYNTVDDNRLLTGEMTDGIIFKSGGTSGKPKMKVAFIMSSPGLNTWRSLKLTVMKQSEKEKQEGWSSPHYAGKDRIFTAMK